MSGSLESNVRLTVGALYYIIRVGENKVAPYIICGAGALIGLFGRKVVPEQGRLPG